MNLSLPALVQIAAQLESLLTTTRKRFAEDRESLQSAIDNTERILRRVEAEIDTFERDMAPSVTGGDAAPSYAHDGAPMPELEPIHKPWMFLPFADKLPARPRYTVGHGLAGATLVDRNLSGTMRAPSGATIRRGEPSADELSASPVGICAGQYDDEEYLASVELDEELERLPLDHAA